MPPDALTYALAVVAALNAVLLLVLLLRGRGGRPAAVVREESRLAREEQAREARALREELSGMGKANADTMLRLIGELRESQVRELQRLQEGNEKKLEEMRATVDEKLSGTLERRLGESFTLVSERLEAVQRGLGEMQSLAGGVGDLKRVLSNVRTRGVWGEYQLHAILEQLLTPDQYCANYRPRVDSASCVEFAVRLPGRDASGAPVFLPIDSKFPQEDYQRLLEAVERADPVALADATAALIRTVGASAREIREKYLHPPATTDFAILFLPTEGLYAEVLRQPGLVHRVQAEHSVVIAGPATLSALLNSLRMGFRTLAIEQRSSEVWQVLAAVKSEFSRFGEVLDRVRKQLHTASNTLEDTGRRTRAMARKLKDVEEMPGTKAEEVLGLGAGAAEDDLEGEAGPE